MNCIFSATPAPGPIRLIIGSHGLQLIQSIIAWHLPAIPALFRVLIAVLSLLALASLILCGIGEPRETRQPSWRRRHAR